MASISPIESMANRYPQLVSFIGTTSAGKSTLIKMLINHDDESRNSENRPMFPSPVVGSVINDTIPTSGDVHLYADPSTHAEQLPILYADCEGFEGGERTPLGAKVRRQNSDHEKREPGPLGNVHSRPIEWANTEEQRQREYTVTALYPRLLYTFSDCVVFVLRNPKTFQSAVLTKLLEWGAAALEKSINQPALPHCIVALNGTDPAVDDKEWDSNYATQSLLSSVKGALDYVEGVPRFRDLADHWRSLGKHIYSMEDLILRYYSSFRVIRIPAKPRYMTINEQVGKLHSMIRANCEESFRSKRRARMLTNADELNTYLQSGFDHFTTHLDVPFNFMAISLIRNPIPNDFGGHILQLCTTISAQQPNHQPGRVAWLFEKLSVMLASCVLLDCARFRKGRVDELFGNYEKFFDYAMGEYLELHYPCSFVSPDGTRQCMLVKARHQPKGHQDDKGIIAAGDYEAAFDSSFLQRWKTQLRAAMDGIQRDFQYELEQLAHDGSVEAVPEERIALDLHVGYLNQFFETVGPAGSIVSHATCFSCLMDVPEHPLPCGHVLCSACIKAYGKPFKAGVSLSCCPLHQESTKWPKQATIRFKPAHAGVRVLSLDGGGIRGIVQLEVLRALEHVLGGHLAIQSFFDLIVGSGTGGMAAVALSMKDRSVDSCIDQFKAVCDHAFTPRTKGIPLLSSIVAAFGSGRRYKTKPLHAALKTAYGEDDFLFGSKTKIRTGARVALTSTSVTGRESILLASYRRPEDLMPAYQLERPHEPDMELKVWQSVAASIAHPGYFKPFVFHGQTYMDGGLRCINPAFIADRERRLIWPDVDEPDLFLSLGSGQNRITILQKIADKVPGSSMSAMIPQPGEEAAGIKKQSSGKWRAKRLDDVLDAELAWTEFRSYAVHERSEAKGRRFIRFNPDLDKEPPPPDSKGDIDSLQSKVRKTLQTPHRLAALRNVAHRLVASSFYLDLQSKATAEKSEQVCSGVIACRFEDNSAEMRALGKVIQDRMEDGFEPYFLIKPDMREDDFSFRMNLTQDVVRTMIDGAVFGMANIYIPLRDESKATSINLFLQPHDGLEPDGFPISGFPRVLLGEQKSSQKPKRSTRTSADQRTHSGQNLRASLKHHPNLSMSDADSISLNGPAADAANVRESSGAWEESARDSRVKQSPFQPSQVGLPKMSLADMIGQNQGSGSSIRQRTNRFWTYIGNNHMAQHPERYSADELAKFAANTAIPPAELESRDNGTLPPNDRPMSQESLHPFMRNLSMHDPAPQELEGQGKHTQRRESNQEAAKVAKYNSICATEFEEDNDLYDYGEGEGEAQYGEAREVVQVRVAPSPILYQHSIPSSTRVAVEDSAAPPSPRLVDCGGKKSPTTETTSSRTSATESVSSHAPSPRYSYSVFPPRASSRTSTASPSMPPTPTTTTAQMGFPLPPNRASGASFASSYIPQQGRNRTSGASFASSYKTADTEKPLPRPPSEYLNAPSSPPSRSPHLRSKPSQASTVRSTDRDTINSFIARY